MSKNDAKRSSDARFVHYVYKLLRLLQLIVKVATTTAPLIHLLRLTLELCHKLMQHISFILNAFFFFSFFFLRTTQELSVELEGRREEQSTLATSGQRLVNTLDSSQNHVQSNNDDALMLRRRLDDMNRRWSGLRAKTVAIR